MVAWTLVFHILGLVFWLGSLLIVTHVLAVHTEATAPEARAALSRLEKKLFNGLAHPGAALMILTGTILVTHNPEYLGEHWLHMKLLLVVVLIALDVRLYVRARAFQAGRIEMRRSECMAMHGVIALVFLAILVLVLTKPFGVTIRRAFLNTYEVRNWKLETRNWELVIADCGSRIADGHDEFPVSNFQFPRRIGGCSGDKDHG